MPRPRIVIDGRYGLRNPRRGVGEYVYQLLKHLAALERPYDLTVLGDASAAPDVVREVGALYPVVIRSAPNFFWWEQVVLPRAARGAALLHGTANLGPLTTTLPQILTIHDVIEWHRGREFPGEIAFRHKVSRFYRMNALRRLAPRARAILTVSRHAQDDLAQTLKVSPERITVTPLAPKPGVMRPHFPKAPYFLALGALDPRKNVMAVLRAMTRVPEPWRLKVVGAEPQALPLWGRRCAELGIAGRVDVAGMVSDDRLADLYRHATAFVYPSYYEGFGLPVLEAMAQGCPVIASDRASLPEVMGAAGLAVPADDPVRLAALMAELAADRPWQVILAHEGMVRAASFSWAHTALLTHQAYLKALGLAPEA
ncbi:MAG: glycosyltransferase family 1 protein [Thermaerobacter sp.]|nr:glycosyltransferase family 1 protein [Thermaerobacter sp.]